MKNKMIAGIFVIVMTGMLLAGCGKKTEDLPETQNTDVEGEQIEQPEDETAPLENTTDAENKTEPETSTPTESDWFEEQGFVVTPQGDFIRSYSLYRPTSSEDLNSDDLFLYATASEDFLKTADLTSNVQIFDAGEKMGYNNFKEIIFLVEHELDKVELTKEFEDNPNCYIKPIVFCFDRYTGTAIASFPYNRPKDEPIRISIEEEIIENGLTKEAICSIKNSASLSETITLYCPMDYDGAIFAVQDYREEDSQILSELNEALMNADRTIGNGPDIGPLLHDDCLFFSLTDK